MSHPEATSSTPLKPPTPPLPPPYSAADPSSSNQQLQPQPEQPDHHLVQRHQPRSAAARFFKAFAVAILVWILVGIFIDGAVQSFNGHWGFPGIGYDIPERITLRNCVFGDKESNTLVVKEYVPIKDALLLLSRGAQLSGHVEISTSSSFKDKAHVKISTSFYGRGADDFLERTKICRIRRDDNVGEIGLGIFTPRRTETSKRQVELSIQVVLPQNSTIPKLDIDLPNHYYQVGELVDLVQFDALSLKSTNQVIDIKSIAFTSGVVSTTNAKINANALRTTKGLITSTNGVITGQYNSSQFLSLTATNGLIETIINMGGSEDGEVDLIMSTTNRQVSRLLSNNHSDTRCSKLQSRVNISATKSGSRVSRIDASTTNGPLLVKIASLPTDSKLICHAKTTNADAALILPVAFEGAYEISAAHGRAVLDASDSSPDPARRGRRRVVTKTSSTRDLMSGEVRWMDGQRGAFRDEDGNVVVSTTNADAYLHL